MAGNKFKDLIRIKWKKLNKKVLAVVCVLLTIVVIAFVFMYVDVFNRGITVAEASKMICFASCDDEYLNNSVTEGYWYESYVTYAQEQGYFEGKEPMDKVTYGDMRKIVKKLGFSDSSINVKLMFPGIMGKDRFVDIYMQLLTFFEHGSDVKMIEALVAGTPANMSELGEWRAYTSEGDFGFTGLILDDKIDRKVSLVVKGDEILTVVNVLSEEVTYRNIWVKYSTDNKVYTNIYGVDREFEINGLEEHVSQVLSDIRLVKGEVKSIDIKTDTISGKVLSVTPQYVEIENYGKVSLDENFMIYDISDDFAVMNYDDIVVGYSLQDFVVADGKVCGAVILKNIDIDNIRVLVKTTGYKSLFHDKASVTCDTPFMVSVGEQVAYYEAGQIVEFGRDNSMFAGGRVTVKAVEGSDGEIKLLNVERSQGNPQYEGHIELSLFDEGIAIVNDINIEKYLKRVVPSEMPASFGTESLKVQAVCARSYAYKQLTNSNYSRYGAHVDDSTQYQVYNNTVEYEASNQAIKETNGLVLSHNGNVVQAYYYSTSCGVGTDISLWGSSVTDYPYFVSRDIGTQARGLNLTDEATFEQFITQKYDSDYDSKCALYRWQMTQTIKELSDGFNAKLAAQYTQLPDRVLTLQSNGEYKSQDIATVGDIQDIKVERRASGGAALVVIVTGSKATVKLTSESVVRNMFGNAAVTMTTNTDTRNMEKLPSAFCIFRKMYDANNVLTGFEIIGGGYGHGIGMSQNAVKSMVDSGMTFDEVLQFFYPGTSFLE